MLIDSTNLVQVLDHNDGLVPVATLSGPMGDLTIQGPSGVVNIPSVLNASGGGLVSSMSAVATGSSAVRALSNRFADEINVKDFGAVGDGVTDDAAAINAALTYLRSVRGSNGTFHLVFPYGTYLVKSSLNFTNLNANFAGGVIDGRGSLIWGQVPGGVIVDALGSRWLRFRDLSIKGDASSVPSIGLQVGRVIGTPAADYNNFTDVNIYGNFTFTAFYNFASETNAHYSCSYRNSATTSDTYCVVMDGLNHWGASSTFVSVTAPIESAQSFNENTFVNCTWQSGGGTGCVWISGAGRHKYIRCYGSNSTNAIFVVYQPNTGAAAATFLDIDCHMETTGLLYAVMFTGATGKTSGYITGLSLEDHNCQAGTAVFYLDPGSSLTTFDLRSTTLRLGGSSPLFSPASGFACTAIHAYLGAGMFTPPLFWSGPIENITYPGYITVPQTQRIVASNGGSATVSYNSEWVELVPSGTIGGYTLTMPLGAGGSTVIGGTTVVISTTHDITTLTVNGNTGQTVAAQPGTLSANSSITYRYDAATSNWQCLGQSAAGNFLPLSGGTVSGATTFSSAGTALSVTNNASVSGTLNVHGAGNALNVDNQITCGSVASNGLVVAGTTGGTSSQVTLQTTAGNSRTINFNTGSSPRWRITADNGAESGGNAGTSLVVQRFDDSGTSLGTPVFWTRSTGQTNIASGLAVTGNTGFNGATPIAKPTVTGSKGANAALASLLSALASYGLITDSST